MMILGLGETQMNNGSSLLDDQNQIYAVSWTTPEYVVIGPNWNLRLVIGPYKVSNFCTAVMSCLIVRRVNKNFIL